MTAAVAHAPDARVQHAAMTAKLCVLSILVACGGGGGNNTPVDSGPGPDAPTVFMDAPPVVPTMIHLSGVAAEQAQSGSTPLAGVTIGIFKNSDETTPIGTATTDAQGNYSIAITTNGEVVDGYLKATKATYVDTYAYPPTPWTGDSTTVDANMLTSSTFNLLVSFGGGSAGKGVITMRVEDASKAPVEGATVASIPASGVYKYSDASGFPTGTTATAADGLSFMFDAPPGHLTVTATKAGTTFHPHPLNVRADKFTTTVINP
jgi:hypothetical protein